MYTLSLFGGLHTSANHQILEQTTYHNPLQHYKSCIIPYSTYHFPHDNFNPWCLATHTSQNTWFNSHYFYRALLSTRLLAHKSTKSALREKHSPLKYLQIPPSKKSSTLSLSCQLVDQTMKQSQTVVHSNWCWNCYVIVDALGHGLLTRLRTHARQSLCPYSSKPVDNSFSIQKTCLISFPFFPWSGKKMKQKWWQI